VSDGRLPLRADDLHVQVGEAGRDGERHLQHESCGMEIN
jgi:hypothetical protein